MQIHVHTLVRTEPLTGALRTSYDADRTMKRFTVSLPDDLYADLRRRGSEATPPASLQQMIRFAVDSLLKDAVPQQDSGIRETPSTAVANPKPPTPVDLLVFSVGGITYGIPIEMVETVAAGLPVHTIPTTSNSLTGVATFRDALTEVHDGGIVLQGRPLSEDETGALLAVPGADSRVLIAVTSVAGLSPVGEGNWATPPASTPPWASALVWTDDRVVTVVDPRSFNL